MQRSDSLTDRVRRRLKAVYPTPTFRQADRRVNLRAIQSLKENRWHLREFFRRAHSLNLQGAILPIKPRRKKVREGSDFNGERGVSRKS